MMLDSIAHNGEGLPKPGNEYQERAAGNWRTFLYRQFTAAGAEIKVGDQS
jgi:hypothetical protein